MSGRRVVNVDGIDLSHHKQASRCPSLGTSSFRYGAVETLRLCGIHRPLAATYCSSGWATRLAFQLGRYAFVLEGASGPPELALCRVSSMQAIHHGFCGAFLWIGVVSWVHFVVAGVRRWLVISDCRFPVQSSFFPNRSRAWSLCLFAWMHQCHQCRQCHQLRSMP